MKIRNLMDYIYKELSKFAPVYFEDMVREQDGSINVYGTNIVYGFDGMFQLTDNKVRRDIPLSINIWYLAEEVYEVEDMIYLVDKALSDAIVREGDVTFKLEKDSNFLTNIPDDDIRLRRKRLRYNVRYYRY